ncbi:MAG: hypothetical protein O3A84_10780, partial [Proteobacteria bacterium]|nr:hypothetical protein [Pseudomonadota bacterium]
LIYISETGENRIKWFGHLGNAGLEILPNPRQISFGNPVLITDLRIDFQMAAKMPQICCRT